MHSIFFPKSREKINKKECNDEPFEAQQKEPWLKF